MLGGGRQLVIRAESCCVLLSLEQVEEAMRKDARRILALPLATKFEAAELLENVGANQVAAAAGNAPPRLVVLAAIDLARHVPPADRLRADGVFDGRFEDRERSLQIYRDHNAYVKENAPSDQLLVFEAKDGWEPLCRFLDVAVPGMPFPYVNRSQEFRDGQADASKWA